MRVGGGLLATLIPWRHHDQDVVPATKHDPRVPISTLLNARVITGGVEMVRALGRRELITFRSDDQGRCRRSSRRGVENTIRRNLNMPDGALGFDSQW